MRGRAAQGGWIGALVALLALLLVACAAPPSRPAADGRLDLRGWDPATDGPVSISGEWLFYPDVLLSPSDPLPPSAQRLAVPEAWAAPDGQGTYLLEVLLPTPPPPALSLRFAGIGGASQVWADGVPLPAAGVLGPPTEEDTRSASRTLAMDDARLELRVQVVNRRARLGGIYKPVVLGDPADMAKDSDRRVAAAAASTVLLSTMGAGFLILFAYRTRDRIHLYFGVFCLLMAARDVLGGVGELALLAWPAWPWSLRIRLEYLTLPLGALFALRMMTLIAVLPEGRLRQRGYEVGCLLLMAAVLLVPFAQLRLLLPAIQIWMLPGIVWAVIMLAQAAAAGRGFSRVMLLCVVVTAAAFLHDMLVSAQLLDSPLILAVPGFLTLLAVQGGVLIREFARSLSRVESLAVELRGAHDRLERAHQATLRFVPTAFLQLLGRRSVTEIQRGDHVELAMSVLFCDMRAFTTLLEKMGPERAFPFINRYLRHMEPPIIANEGFISQYLGDAIMALFPTGADASMRAALGMVEALDAFNAVEPEGAVRVGIGVGSGPLMLGAIGGVKRLDGSVIGDTVNQASRLEGMTKIYGVTILIDEATVERLSDPGALSLRELDRVVSKGRTTPSRIYEVLDALPADARAVREANLPRWEAALQAWRQGDFAGSQALLEACLRADPEDATAALYVERCAEMIERGGGEAPSGWDGITRLQRKS